MDWSKTCAAPVELPRAEYATPHLVCLGKITAVTQKSGGSADGGAARMAKSGGG